MNIVLYILVVAIWGTTWLPIKMQLGAVSAEVSVFYRFLIASILLLFWSFIKKKKFDFTVKQHLMIAALGLMLFSTNYVLFYLGSYNLVSGLLSVVFSTILIFNIILSILIFKTKADKNVFIAALVGLTGLVLTFLNDLQQASFYQTSAVGVAFCLLGTFVASMGNIMSSYLQKQRVSVMAMNALGMTYGAVFLGVFCFFYGSSFNFDMRVEYIGSLLYLAVFGSVIGFGCYLTLLGRLGPERVAYSAVMFPVVALAVSTFFEDFVWSLERGLGVSLIIIGNILILKRRPEVVKEQSV